MSWIFTIMRPFFLLIFRLGVSRRDGRGVTGKEQLGYVLCFLCQCFCRCYGRPEGVRPDGEGQGPSVVKM